MIADEQEIPMQAVVCELKLNTKQILFVNLIPNLIFIFLNYAQMRYVNKKERKNQKGELGMIIIITLTDIL